MNDERAHFVMLLIFRVVVVMVVVMVVVTWATISSCPHEPGRIAVGFGCDRHIHSVCIDVVTYHLLRERERVSNSVCMDLRQIMMLFMSHPDVACSLAVLLCCLIVLVGVGVMTQTLAMVTMVVVMHPNMSCRLAVLLGRFVVLVGVGVVTHLIVVVALLVRVVVVVVLLV